MRTVAVMVLVAASAAVVLPAAAQQPIVRDSAGIRIVQNRSRSTVPDQYRVGGTPVFNVGGTESDPATEFNHNDGYVRGVPLSNGWYAVADVFRVHFFDAGGERQRVSGTRGNGPLELLYMTNICVTRGDTIIVADTQNNRLAVIDSRGNIVRTFPRPVSTYTHWNSCLGDGTIVMNKTVASTVASKPDMMTLIRTRLDGTVVNSIGPIAAPLPGTISASIQYVAGRDRIYVTNAVDNDIRMYASSGALRQIIRTADPLKPLSGEELDRRTTSARATATRTGRPMAPIPKHHPPYVELIVSSDGLLWAREYAAMARDPKTWIAFDANGAMVGRLVTPAIPDDGTSPVVLGFGPGTITMRRWDADGATFITTYPLARNAR